MHLTAHPALHFQNHTEGLIGFIIAERAGAIFPFTHNAYILGKGMFEIFINISFGIHNFLQLAENINVKGDDGNP